MELARREAVRLAREIDAENQDHVDDAKFN